MKPSLCLNMIVKNEAARIERCLTSALPHVKAVAIVDTGSTDDTPRLIRDICARHSVPCVIKIDLFKDFSQARNLAFGLARAHRGKELPWTQFALLMDADMELVVLDRDELIGLSGDAPSFTAKQTGGAVTYSNTRIVNLDLGTPPYVGVTHEYIDAPSAGELKGIRFIDHADGANRPDKYVRDAALLEKALVTDPNNGRSLFYLGNTYLDGGKLDLAADAYRKRIALGGWAEETHDAMMKLAWCLRPTDPQGFTAKMIEAYNFRPTRAEPLYELAKYYRENNQQPASLLFSKQGMKVKRPDDLLFVNDYVYSHGCRFEYAVCGYYDPEEHRGSFQATNDLALDPACPAEQRAIMRTNLWWYTKPLKDYCPSFVDTRLDFEAPAGYTAMNPSIEECNGVLHANIRCVNYRIDDQGRYMIGPKDCNDAPIDTRNYLVTLTDKLEIQKTREILWHRPEAKFPQVTGLEDIRLYRNRGDLCFSACIREQASNGTCQQIRGWLSYDPDEFMITRDTVIMSGEDSVEKNWMPLPGNTHDFLYRLDRIRHPDGTETKHPSKLDVSQISGSSQLLSFRGGHLAVVHEASTDPTNGKRTYWHRFAWFYDGKLRRLSLPFVFLARQIEFCAGLCYSPDQKHVLISYGVRDCEAHIAEIAVEEVGQMIWKFHED